MAISSHQYDMSFGSVFRSPETEAAFLEARRGQRAFRIKLVCLGTALAYFSAILGDWAQSGPSATLAAMAALRTATALVGLACVVRVFKSVRNLDILLFAYMLTISTAEATEAWLKLTPQDSPGAPFILVIVLTFYLFIPLRPVYAAVAGTYAMAVYALALALVGVDSSYLITVVQFFLVVNIVGTLLLRTMERSRRMEFRNLMEEQEANRRLNQEVHQRKLAEKRLRKLVNTDELTGLATRRRLMDLAAREFARFRRYESALTVMALDADRFKRVNDTYGHAAGDEVLRLLGRTISQVLRSTDICGRTGGEEFIIVMPETDLATGQQVGERLREAISNNPVPWQDGHIPLTVSIGLAQAGPDDASLDDLIRRADMGLYLAKSQGRDRVCLASPVDSKGSAPKAVADNSQSKV